MPKQQNNANSDERSPVADFPALLNTKEASLVLRVKMRALQMLLSQGKLPGIKVGNEWRLKRDDLLTLINTGKAPRSTRKYRKSENFHAKRKSGPPVSPTDSSPRSLAAAGRG